MLSAGNRINLSKRLGANTIYTTVNQLTSNKPRVMTMRILLFVSLILLLTNISFAQSKKKKDKNVPSSGKPTTLQPSFPTLEYGPKNTRGKIKGNITYNAEKRYYQQKKEVAKQKRKAEKEMMKPQYSDPMYFGHKSPPKKHSPRKMKYCKECGIRH